VISVITIEGLGLEIESSGDNTGGIAGSNIVAGSDRGDISDVNISGLLIVALGDYVGGVAGYNDGDISDSHLRPTVSITGNDYVAWIAGLNDVNGEIDECTVIGNPPPGPSGMDIEGAIHVGGIAGENHGTIGNFTIENALDTIRGEDFVGGVAGSNTATGNISDGSIINVRIISGGSNVGSIVGANDGGIVDITSIDVEDVVDEDGNPITAPDPDPAPPPPPPSAPDEYMCDCDDCDCDDCNPDGCECADCEPGDGTDGTDGIIGTDGTKGTDDDCPDCIDDCPDCVVDNRSGSDTDSSLDSDIDSSIDSSSDNCINNCYDGECICEDDNAVNMAVPIIGAMIAGPAIAGTITKFNSRMTRRLRKKTKGRK
jgi:hypothetical protein